MAKRLVLGACPILAYLHTGIEKNIEDPRPTKKVFPSQTAWITSSPLSNNMVLLLLQ